MTREFTADEAVYTRQMSDGELASIYIPFANEENSGVDFGIEESIGEIDKTLTYTAAEHSANEPCLVYTNEGGSKIFSARNVTISPTETQLSDSRMFGNYVHGTREETVYKVENGKLVPTNKVEPFRAYFSEESVANIPLGVTDITLSIDENTEIYNLLGIKMKGDLHQLAPDVYIVNGHKVYIK